MSDGLANTGVTDHGEIARLVRGAKRDGVRISAMGLGRDYDEDLMQSVAENGGGRYYYIEHPTQMARVFQEELGSLFETTARDVEVKFSGTAVVRKVEVVGYDDANGTQETPAAPSTTCSKAKSARSCCAWKSQHRRPAASIWAKSR